MFGYSTDELAALCRALSEERLSTYLTRTDGDLDRAIRLYERNTRFSEALYGPLQSLEIVLRNTLHSVLTDAFGPTWYSGVCPLQHPQTSMAKRAVGKLPGDAPAGKVVAELNLGFWVGLIGNQYERSLWIPCLHRAFRGARLDRKEAHAILDDLRLLRNRIAHHEPILSRNLTSDHQAILEATSWICPVTATWIAYTSRFEKILVEEAAFFD